MQFIKTLIQFLLWLGLVFGSAYVAIHFTPYHLLPKGTPPWAVLVLFILVANGIGLFGLRLITRRQQGNQSTSDHPLDNEEAR